MIRMILTLFALSILVAPPVNAQTEFLPEQPAMLVELTPADALTKGTYVQAELRMTLRLRGRYAYEALSITLPTIQDAEIITLQRPRTRYLVSYAGAGHVYEAGYAIIPQRSGPLKIPPIRIVGRVTTQAGEDLNFDLANEGFSVQVDPAVEGFSGEKWFVADGLEISEKWSQPLDDLREGDIVEREVHIRAIGSSGDRMPTLATPRATGATLIDSGRTTETEITGAGTVGHLWQSWDVRIDRDNFAEIAPVRLPWWSTESHAEEVVSLPVTRIEPLPADTSAIAEEIMAQVRADHALNRMLWIDLLFLLAAPAILCTLWFIYILLPSRADIVLKRQNATETSPKALLCAIERWAVASKLTSPTNPVGELQQNGGTDLGSAITHLNKDIFSENTASHAPKELTKLCLNHARTARINAMWHRLSGVGRAIVGPKIRLNQH